MCSDPAHALSAQSNTRPEDLVYCKVHSSHEEVRTILSINRILNVGLTMVATIVLFVGAAHIVVNAILRAFLDSPIYGTNEVVTFWYMPLLVMFGIPAAKLQGEHIVVTLVTSRVDAFSDKMLRRFSSIISLILILGFVWFGFQEAAQQFEVLATAGVTDIVTWPTYFAVPIAFIIMAYFDILNLLRPNAPLLKAEPNSYAESVD